MSSRELMREEMSGVSDLMTQIPTVALVGEQGFSIIQWTIGTIFCLGICIFGTVTNIINIVCFTSQGFKDPVNVSLTGLAISDICSLVTLLWSNICAMLVFSSTDLSFDPIETQYLVSGIPHTAFARITGWITALITLERCLCITVPLKVKDIITSRRISVIIICIFVLHIFSVVPVYVVCRLDMKWSLHKNRTIFGLVSNEQREQVETLSFLINNGFLSFSAFIIIIICTVVLGIKLQSTSQWRKISTAISTQADTLSTRNRKVAKMIVVISLLFIICFIPISFSFIAMTLVPGLSVDGKHKNILIITSWFGVVLESINSSVNIFVYYRMSSKYRETFQKVFLLVAYTQNRETNTKSN